MKKFFFYFLINIFIVNCSGYEFVYKNQHPVIDEMKSKVVLIVSGDESPITTSLLNQKLGKANNSTYLLEVVIKKTITPITINKDGTASKIEIKNIGTYVLKNTDRDCQIVSKKIYTLSTYNSATSGYDFGADVSRDDILRKNLKENIDSFFYYLSAEVGSLGCSDEN